MHKCSSVYSEPHPVFLANTVFEVRVAAVVQLKIVLVKSDFAQLAKLEGQQRLWPRCGRVTPAAPTGVERQ
jgi:hypothetical protein